MTVTRRLSASRRDLWSQEWVDSPDDPGTGEGTPTTRLIYFVVYLFRYVNKQRSVSVLTVPRSVRTP